MADKQVNYTISGDSSSYVAAMERAARSTTDATAGIKGQLDNVGKAFEVVQGKLLAITAIVGGGSFFKAAIQSAIALTGETNNLAKRLQLTSTEASALNTALGDIGSDSETYIGAFDKFAKQIKTNEDGLQAMGLKTRDSSGHLRDSNTLFMEAIQVVGEYKPGLDQTTAAMELFGKGVEDVMKLQRLNNQTIEDAKEKNAELGMTITKENVAAAKAYKAAMNDVGDVLNAVQNQIGQAVMPVFTEMAAYFASSGPYVVSVFKGALTGLLVVFRAISVAVKVVFEVCVELFSTLVDQIGNVGTFISAVLRGDLQGALTAATSYKDRFMRTGTMLAESVVDGFKSGSAAFAGDLDRLWGDGTEVAAPKGGKKQQGDFDKEKKQKADPSFMKYYEAALEEERRLATTRDAIHGMSKQEELAFWDSLLANAKLTTADQVEVQRKASALRIEILKDEAKNAAELGKLGQQSREQEMLNAVALDAEEAKNRQALGQITQQQLLAQEQQFEDRRYQIRQASLQAQLAQLDPTRDPVQVEQTNLKLQELEQQHQLRLMQIRNQSTQLQAQEQGRIWQDLTGRVSSLWDQGVNAIMNRTFTWTGAFRAVGAQVVGWFASSVVKPMVMQWLFGETAKTGATATGNAARTGIEALAAAKSVVLWAATTVKNIMANAYAAMAAAWQAIAGIPIVGPALAVGAAAAAFVGVAALAGKVASAEGGFDIPAGVNPMTQLHEKEMVLPAKHADVIRGLADGQGGGLMGGGDWNIQLKAMPMRGNFFMLHRDDLVDALRSATRDKAMKK